MSLYAAVVSCRIRSPKKTGTKIHKLEVQTFRHAVPARSEGEAIQILQSTFPWTFYKHVKIQWEVIAENV